MESSITPDSFKSLIRQVTDRIGTRAFDEALQTEDKCDDSSEWPLFTQIFDGCQAAIAAGWMCGRESGGIRHGRVIKPSGDLHGFSVDVVDMKSLQGPHHAHPQRGN